MTESGGFMSKNISLDLYKIFCVVVKSGNMSAAAKELFISQPAVSMSIHQLEEKIGAPLLIRTSKGVRMTPEGAVLYEYLEKAIGLIDLAERKYEQMVNMEMGELKINAGGTVITHYLLPYLKKYIEEYPEVTVKVGNGSSEQSLKQLRSGEVDFCFVNLPFDDDISDLEITECIKIHGCVVGGARYKHLAKEGVLFRDLEKHNLILLDKSSNTRKFLDYQAGIRGKEFAPIMEIDSTDLMLELVKANLGITITFRELVDIDNETIFELPCDITAPERSIGLARLKNVTLSTAARRFVTMLETE